MTRHYALLALLLLTACSPKLAEIAAEPVVIEEEVVVVEPEVAAGISDSACTPGDDDGIGGTGCKID